MMGWTDKTPIAAALGSAALFGASTPLAKQLVTDLPALWVAGLVYLGSGIGLSIVRIVRDRGWTTPRLPPAQWRWLSAAILFGGVAGPALLMLGLRTTSGAAASLLLNLEAALTAALAWVVFRENTDRRIVMGMLMIVAGSVALSWPEGSTGQHTWLGPLAIAGACLSWAIDNNLTRRISASDAVFTAGIKGLAAGGFNTVLAFALQPSHPAWHTIGAAMLIGFFGYGVSLVLFVLALRGLGTARTGAYFSTAPFIGATIAIMLFGESTSPAFWLAAGLMAGGVWLHLTERHQHEHAHLPIEHEHTHVHDAHHQHVHDFEWNGQEPHSHPHRHAGIVHSHRHFPDLHHQHSH